MTKEEMREYENETEKITKARFEKEKAITDAINVNWRRPELFKALQEYKKEML